MDDDISTTDTDDVWASIADDIDLFIIETFITDDPLWLYWWIVHIDSLTQSEKDLVFQEKRRMMNSEVVERCLMSDDLRWSSKCQMISLLQNPPTSTSIINVAYV